MILSRRGQRVGGRRVGVAGSPGGTGGGQVGQGQGGHTRGRVGGGEGGGSNVYAQGSASQTGFLLKLLKVAEKKDIFYVSDPL